MYQKAWLWALIFLFFMRTSTTASPLAAPAATLADTSASLFIIELEERLELATVAAVSVKCLSDATPF